MCTLKKNHLFETIAKREKKKVCVWVREKDRETDMYIQEDRYIDRLKDIHKDIYNFGS